MTARPRTNSGRQSGEAVMGKRRAGGALPKMTCSWEDVVCFGLKGSSGDVLVAGENVVWKTCSVQRKPLEARCTAAVVDSVKHVPLRVSEDELEVDGERLTAAEMGLRMQGHDVEKEGRNEPSFHRVKIRRATSRSWAARPIVRDGSPSQRGTA